MKNKILIFAAALGLLIGGIVIGQSFDGDVGVMTAIKPTGIELQADKIYSDYGKTLAASYNPSAVQITQVGNEASVRLQYLQIKQNAEIIRLLTELNKKK